jgi:hypothetical protein
MTNPQPYYRMMKEKHAIGCKLQPSGPHIDPDVEAILAKHRKGDRIDRATAVYLAEKPEFSALGISYDVGFIHIVEPIGEIQRRDQAWLGELQWRHEKRGHLKQFSEKPLIGARRKEFERMSDEGLCESYFSGAMSRNPAIEIVVIGGTVTGYHSETPVRVRRGFQDFMPKE